MTQLTGQMLRFAAVGVANTAVGLSAIWALMLMGMDPIAANAAGFLVGLSLSFVLNRQWTFRRSSAAAGRRESLNQLLRFGLTFAVSWSLNLLVLLAGLEFTPISPYILQIAGSASYTIAFFVLCRFFVFRDKVA